LVISEVRADAGQGAQDAAFEWVEIHNPTGEAVDLGGWSLADNRGADVLPMSTVEPGAWLVVGGSEAVVAEFAALGEAGGEAAGSVAFVAVEDGWIGNGLANSGDAWC